MLTKTINTMTKTLVHDCTARWMLRHAALRDNYITQCLHLLSYSRFFPNLHLIVTHAIGYVEHYWYNKLDSLKSGARFWAMCKKRFSKNTNIANIRPMRFRLWNVFDEDQFGLGLM